VGQEDVQLTAMPWSAIPSYFTVSHQVKFRFSTLVMPVTDSAAAGWSELKRLCTDKITRSPPECPVFASGGRVPGFCLKVKACVCKALYFSAHFSCILQRGSFKQLHPLQNLGYVSVTG